MTVLAALLALALLPQEPTAKATLGRVLDLDGRPVAGADVVFLHRPLSNCWEAPGEHRLNVRSDAAGMFRAELRQIRSYSLWASWAGGATACEEGVMAGDFVTLKAHALARPRRVRVEGREAWAAVGPLQFRVLVGSENVDLLPVSGADGVVDLPALPWTYQQILEVVDRNGEVLWAATPEPAEDGLAFAIPPPFEVEVTVRDADGAPIPGAQVLRHIRNYWMTSSPAVFPGDRFRCLWPLCGVTGADGTVRVRVPVEGGAGAEQPPKSLHFMARKSGFRTSLGGWTNGKPYRDGRVGEPGPLLLTLAKPDQSRIDAPPSLAMRGLPVRLTWRVHARDGNGASGLPFMDVATAGERTVPLEWQMAAGDELEQAWTALPDAVRAPLLATHGCTLPVTCHLPVSGSALGGAQLQFTTGDLRVIQVSSDDGRPAERAVVLVSPWAKGQPEPQRGTLLRTDRLGRALAAVGEGGVHVAVITATGAGAGLLRADDKSPWRLQLRPLQSMTGRVLDEQGAPVGGVQVSASRYMNAAGGGAEDAISPRELAYLVQSLPAVVTGTDGRFRFGYVPCDVSMSFELVDPLLRWRLQGLTQFDCRAEKPEEVVLNVTPAGK